ncbi:MAG: signal peptide peptidase SppA [Clostridia bacterium]|nr:signal peptide peptidase SppA [Clostridia bacterium]
MGKVNLTEPDSQGIRYYQIESEPLIPPGANARASEAAAGNAAGNPAGNAGANNASGAFNGAAGTANSASGSGAYREIRDEASGKSRTFNGNSGNSNYGGGNANYGGGNGGNSGNSNYGGGNYSGGNGSGPKKNTTVKALIIIGIVLLICVGFAACAKLVTSAVRDVTYGVAENLTGAITDTKVKDTILPSEPYIAELHVDGEISSSTTNQYGVDTAGYHHKWTLKQMDALMKDKNCKGIIFYINTPGGAVYETDELYLKIKEYQEKTGNPVYAYMGSMAASGGYYISAACDTIIANRNCWTGSIGVTVGTYFDFSDLLANYGVKTVTIDSGKNKSMGSMFEEMTDEQQAIMQSLVDEAYAQFVGIVADGRNMEKEDVIALADGRIYSAKQALKLGLIDDIATFDEALKAMIEDNDLKGCGLLDISYSPVSVFDSLFTKALSGSLLQPLGNSEVNAIMEITKSKSSEPVSYICEALKNDN